MSKPPALLAAALALLAAPAAPADDLTVGDPAPKLAVKKFLKGEPVAAFDKGKVYVVEFWATWCGPCRASIPHLTELQKAHKDVTFIGVSIWENDPAEIAPFVAKMGDQMAYRVAQDDVPEDAPPDRGKMATAWMTAAGEDGIPAAFIVNADGKVAWIGHPMELDEPLAQVASGKQDLAAAVARHKEAKAQARKLKALEEKLDRARAADDPKAHLAALDEAIAADADLEAAFGLEKFLVLRKAGDRKAALAYGRRLTETVLKDDPNALNNLAWSIVDPDAEPRAKPDADSLALALAAARRADRLAEGKDPAIGDTLALTLFHSGEIAKALETQRRAIESAKGTPFEDDEGMKARLDQYRKAAEAKPVR